MGPSEQFWGGLQSDEDWKKKPKFLCHQTKPAVQQEVRSKMSFCFNLSTLSSFFHWKKNLTVHSYSSFVFVGHIAAYQNVWFYSHSIFSIRIIRVEDIGVPRVLGISEWVHQVACLTSNKHKFAISCIFVYCQTSSVWPRWIRTLLTYSEHWRETEGGGKHQQLTPHTWKVHQRH